eukprot:gene7852-biopygen5282
MLLLQRWRPSSVRRRWTTGVRFFIFSAPTTRTGSRAPSTAFASGQQHTAIASALSQRGAPLPFASPTADHTRCPRLPEAGEGGSGFPLRSSPRLFAIARTFSSHSPKRPLFEVSGCRHHPLSPHERRMSKEAKYRRRQRLQRNAAAEAAGQGKNREGLYCERAARQGRSAAEREAWGLVHRRGPESGGPRQRVQDMTKARELLRVAEVQRQVFKKLHRRR